SRPEGSQVQGSTSHGSASWTTTPSGQNKYNTPIGVRRVENRSHRKRMAMAGVVNDRQTTLQSGRTPQDHGNPGDCLKCLISDGEGEGGGERCADIEDATVVSQPGPVTDSEMKMDRCDLKTSKLLRVYPWEGVLCGVECAYSGDFYLKVCLMIQNVSFCLRFLRQDFYVKVCLMIQNKMVKTKKSETSKKTTSPSFNESFNFKLPVASLDTASVNVSVMQYISGHKDKLVGRIVLGSFMFARGKELDHWNEMIATQREQVTNWHVLT
ncbi:hypothetical protein BaRGS_00001248, partial [Batillaria attramentaria]